VAVGSERSTSAHLTSFEVLERTNYMTSFGINKHIMLPSKATINTPAINAKASRIKSKPLRYRLLSSSAIFDDSCVFILV
jgi:hypothetical protein